MGTKRVTTLLLILLYIIGIANSQEIETDEETVRYASDLKSGNSQDVLISFLQLAVKDITGDNKSFNFQSSIFGIKAAINPDLYIDDNYLKKSNICARNIIFNAGIEFDEGFKFKQAPIGIKWAIINNRDKSVFDFKLNNEMEWVFVKEKAINLFTELLNDAGNANANEQVENSRNFFDPEKNKTTSDLSEEFKNILQGILDTSRFFKGLNIDGFKNYRQNEYQRMSAIVESKGILTLEGKTTIADKGKGFSSVNINSEYLKGVIEKEIAGNNIELDIKGAIDFTDDTTSIESDINRGVFSASGGLNWVIKLKKAKPILELKAQVTYYNVFTEQKPAEKKSGVTFESVIRLRVTNESWFPVTLKYDPATGNVFGFLNITVNTDWFKNLIPKAD
ncbi:MAG: hypothetical protein AB7G44_07250 [Bacteroidia bacterium]